MIENLQSVMGSVVEDGHVIYAPGAAADKTSPLGDVAAGDNFKSFQADLGKWLHNNNHFSQSASVTAVPIYAIGFSCFSVAWSSSSLGLLPERLCQPYVYYLGTSVRVHGINLSALVAATRVGGLIDGSSPVSLADLCQLSRTARAVLGVHLFGFTENGTLGGHNFDFPTSFDEHEALLAQWLHNIIQWTKEEIERILEEDPRPTKPTHDYPVETLICNTSDSWCTIENIACWGRRYPAPFDDPADHESEIENESQSDLMNLLINDEGNELTLFGTSPIESAVGKAGGLDPHAVVNTTLDGHELHDPNNPADCPKPLDSEGDWRTNTWNGCSQVLRAPHQYPNGNIAMRTRGYGVGALPRINQEQGPRIFKKVDEQMKAAIENAPGNLCSSQASSE